MAGKLILCATPIGNLGDITARVLDALRDADRIAAEDTRNSKKLLTHFDIHTPLISYHENNRFDRGRELVEYMLAGETIALITDAGTPAISDPGEELVRMAYEAGIEVTSLPGAAACITALTLSGLPTRRFAMEGFLPRTAKDQKEILEELKNETRTMIFYESPHHLHKTLRTLAETFGEERRISICRELTKIHEEVLRMTLGEVADVLAGGQNPACGRSRSELGRSSTRLASSPSADVLDSRDAGDLSSRENTATLANPRGEYVLVVEGKSREEILAERLAAWGKLTLEEHMGVYLEQGLDEKDAMKRVAKDRGVSKSDVYSLWKIEKRHV